MGTTDPALVASATATLQADAARTDDWALASVTNGELVSVQEAFQVWRSDAAGEVDYRKSEAGAVTAKAIPLSEDAVQAFATRVEGADSLCDVDVLAIGGVTHHYVHVSKQADGTIKTIGAFVARNPDVNPAGAAQAGVVSAFAALITNLPLNSAFMAALGQSGGEDDHE
jgi:hypothetical protein